MYFKSNSSNLMIHILFQPTQYEKMGQKTGQCNKSSTTKGILIVSPSLEERPAKAKDIFSLWGETNPAGHQPVFQCLRDKKFWTM